MTAFYVDTSGLVKRYAAEVGSAWIRNLTDPAIGHDVFTNRITAVEMIAALYRRVRTGATTSADAQRAEATFRTDWRWQYQILEVTVSVVDRAMLLARKHGLRGYDAVHIAAALELHTLRRAQGASSLVFISADQGQLRTAAAEGLTVDDPAVHP